MINSLADQQYVAYLSGDMPSIYVDFDSTLAHYDKWRGPTHTGKPVWPMLKMVRGWLKDGKKVVIFTARASNQKAVKAIEKWCQQWLGRKLKITNVKGKDVEVFYDDRAVAVTANKGVTESRLTWYRKPNHSGITCRLDSEHYCYVGTAFGKIEWMVRSRTHPGDMLNDRDINVDNNGFKDEREAIKDFESVYPKWKSLSRKVNRAQTRTHWRKVGKSRKDMPPPMVEALGSVVWRHGLPDLPGDEFEHYKLAVDTDPTKWCCVGDLYGIIEGDRLEVFDKYGEDTHSQEISSERGATMIMLALAAPHQDHETAPPMVEARRPMVSWYEKNRQVTKRGTELVLYMARLPGPYEGMISSYVAGDNQEHCTYIIGPFGNFCIKSCNTLEAAKEAVFSCFFRTDWKAAARAEGLNPDHGIPEPDGVTPPTVESFAKLLEDRNPSKICVMAMIPESYQDDVLALGDSIEECDLYEEDGEFGLEKKPHVTCLYGLLPDEVTLEDIKGVTDEFGPIHLTLGKTSMFENERYDVVKVEVKSADLHALNAALRQLPYDNDYDTYVAHATIAYVNKGCGKKYCDDDSLEGINIICDKLDISDGDGGHQYITLT